MGAPTSPPAAAGRTLRVLSVDLGGWKVGVSTFRSEPGTQDPDLLSVGVWTIYDRARTESPGMRWLRLRRHLDEVLTVSGFRPDLVVYEEVRNHTSRDKGSQKTRFNVDAAHAYGAAEAELLAWCAANELEVTNQPIATIKRAALGKGGGAGTDKRAVLEAARRRWPFHVFEDDNAADSAWIGIAALVALGRAKDTDAPPKPPKPAKKKPRKPTATPVRGLFDEGSER